jgi:hypothetical protein
MRTRILNKTPVLVLLFFFCACGSHQQWKLNIEIPGKTSLDISQFDKIVITNFLVEQNPAGFDINKEIVDYISFELGQQTEIPIASEQILFSKEDLEKNPRFWRNHSAHKDRLVFLTGYVSYKEELHVGLSGQEKKQHETPFPEESKLARHKFFALHIDIYLIEGRSGNILYSRNFNEKSFYKNINQTAPFAFFPLIQRVRNKLFRNILGESLLQERYLISNLESP